MFVAVLKLHGYETSWQPSLGSSWWCEEVSVCLVLVSPMPGA